MTRTNVIVSVFLSFSANVLYGPAGLQCALKEKEIDGAGAMTTYLACQALHIFQDISFVQTEKKQERRQDGRGGLQMREREK